MGQEVKGKIIMVGGVKGGVGKSTLSINIATFLAYNKKSVLIFDADESQHSSASWIERREDLPDDKYPQLFCVEKSGRINSVLKEMSFHYDYIVVDTGRSDSVEFRSGLVVADKLIVPTVAAQFDLEVLFTADEIIDGAKSINEKLDSVVVINKAPTNTKRKELASEAKKFILESEEIQHLSPVSTVLHERAAYSSSVVTGESILETNDTKAKTEFKKLMKELNL